MIDQGKLIYSLKWDCLVVLDACRYDFFNEVNWIDGDLLVVRSRGSCTREWLERTFTKFLPVTYISANPYISRKRNVFGWRAPRYFKDVVEVWRDGWDERIGTVHPQTVIERARHVVGRVIIHLIQPHAPFILENGVIEVERWDNARNEALGLDNRYVARHYNEFTRDELLYGYRENLRLALKAVDELVAMYDRVIVTSDHGELLGDGGLYGHPCGSEHPLLRNVPFLIVR